MTDMLFNSKNNKISCVNKESHCTILTILNKKKNENAMIEIIMTYIVDLQ